MKNVYLKIGLLITTLLSGSGSVMASDLPPCPSSGYLHNCFGTFTWGSNTKWAGDKYVGEWKDDKKHGQGTYNYAGGEKYVGEWRDNERHGKGTLTLADGEKYVGEFSNGKYHGQGTYIDASGEKYVGGYKDGKKHGQGILTSAEGIVKEGIWWYDEFQYTRKRPADKSTSGLMSRD